MELEGKTALIFGAGGQIGAQVSRVFAREGAKLYLSGPRSQRIDALASELRGSGASVDVQQVDATDDKAV